VSFWSKPGARAMTVSLGACLALSSCGYHVAGQANLVPKTIHTIAVPAFANNTVRYKLSDLLPEAVSRELIARTHYQVVNDPTQADAVLRGSVISYLAYPTLIDQATGRTSGLQINVRMEVSLVERSTNKVIYNRPNFEAHERYELSVTNNLQYFDESGAALQRLSKDLARDLVSSILENF
jgi:outer membrane lipopolysaccharide assembly protein LptE/RlpB